MNKKMTNCKSCGKEIAKSAKVCPHCGAKNKKPIYKKWWFIFLIVVVLLVAIGGSESESDNKNTSSIDNGVEGSTSSKDVGENIEKESEKIETPAKTEYYVGDMLEDGNMKIVYMSSGDYLEENEFMQPADGKKYIYLQFAFENISDSSDTSVSFYSFECFADGYATEMYYGGEEGLSATLSAGRATTGYIYFEVPTDAEVIEIEYETNVFTEEKSSLFSKVRKNPVMCRQ